jgi:hypothetical protein
MATSATSTGKAVVTIGNTNDGSSLTLQSGTGNTSLLSGGNVTVGTSDTTGTLLVLDTKTDFTAAQTSDPTGVAGGMYYNSSTGSFRCYEVDHWRNCLLTARSGYHHIFEMSSGTTNEGELVSANNGGAGAGISAAINGETGHPGINELNSGTTLTGWTYIGSPGDNEILLGNNDYWRAESEVRIPTLSVAAQRFIVRAGFIEQSINSDGSDGCFFKYSDNVNNVPAAKWQGVCLSGGSSTVCDSGITVNAATWYRLTVVVNAAGTSADFRINGTSACTVIATIPTTAGHVTGRGVSIQKTVGTTDRDLDVDYEEIEAQFGTPR